MRAKLRSWIDERRGKEEPSDVPSFSIRGIRIAAIDLKRASRLISARARASHGDYVTVTGAHGIVESSDDDLVLRAHQGAFLVVPDGMPLVWLGRRLGFPTMGRVYGPDLMECIFSKPECRELRHFFYGGRPEVVSKLTSAIATRFGQINVVGTYSPAMNPLGFCEDDAIVRRIRDCRPQIIWVGLSSPKQEVWLHMHMPKIGVGVGIGVGAAFDFLSGTSRQAPRWVQRSGLEWLFRVANEPRRLFWRYFFVVPRFSFLFFETLWSRRSKRARLGPTEAPLP
jgi:N-acetylglucosaminyldiphosphoundecaprenol N-acetyl-beta-D-mannosaminyltransferase